MLHLLHHFICHVSGSLGPNINHFIILFTTRYQAFGVLLSDLSYLVIGLFDNIPLFSRNHHIVHTYRETCLSSVQIPNIL